MCYHNFIFEGGVLVMDYVYDLNKESSIIYSNINLKKNEELMAFFLYKKLVKKLFDLLVNICDCGLEETFSFFKYHFPRISHNILKDNLSKYSSIVSLGNNKIDSRDFLFGFLDYISDNHCLDEIIDISEFVKSYKDDVNNNINNYNLVSIVNKKSICFSDKANILFVFDCYLDKISGFIYELLECDKANDYISQLEARFINFIVDMDTEKFCIANFNNELKNISFNFVSEMMECGQLDLNSICKGPFYDLYSYFDEYGKVVFKNLIPYIITDSDINVVDYIKIRDKVKEELKLSNFKLNYEMSKFYRNYKKLRKIYFSSEEEKGTKKIKKN